MLWMKFYLLRWVLQRLRRSGLLVSIEIELFLLDSQFHRPRRKRLLHRFVSITAEKRHTFVAIVVLRSDRLLLTQFQALHRSVPQTNPLNRPAARVGDPYI